MTGANARETLVADEVVVRMLGDVDESDRVYAQQKVAHVARIAPRPVRYAKTVLHLEPDPARARPAVVTAELDVDGHMVRAKADAPTMHEAIDLAEARLRIALDRLAHHDPSARRRVRDHASWHHGDVPRERLPYFDRPEGEREIVPSTTHAVAVATPEEAALDLDLLGYEFVLFRDDATGDDCVVARAEDGVRVLTAAQAEVLPLEDAIEQLDVSREPYVFFRDTETERGRVLYHRYDGHYGLIEPAGT